MTEPHALVGDLIANLNKVSKSSTAWLQGSEGVKKALWGVPVPYLAPAYVMGGCSVIPSQRFIGVSGAKKSYKSTLEVEFGNWFIQAGGYHMIDNTENKMDKDEINSMVAAMSWWNGVAEQQRRMVVEAADVTEWQDQATAAIEWNRGLDQTAKGSRMPLLITIDSLTGRQTADVVSSLAKEGHAEGRGFPVRANQITNYLEALNLMGTTVTFSWVQHLKQVIDGGGKSYGGPEFKEKGADAAQFACSAQLRLSAGKTAIRMGSWPTAPYPDIPVEGYEIYIKAALTCVGPGNRTISVPLLWQYVEDEDGNPRQIMWFDWYHALGQMLVRMKYDEKWRPKLFDYDKKRLAEALHFTEQSKRVKCEALGLDGATYGEFGKAIEDHPEARAAIAKYLCIGRYESVQDAVIEFGEKPKKRGKKGG